ncbi:MAG: type II secretion system F family protein [Jatrophihabitantaceae bacterium]
MVSWLLLGVALLLLPRRGPTGRHRTVVSTPPRRRPSLPGIASVLTLLTVPAIAGRIGLVLAVPVALGVFAGTRRLADRARPRVDRQAMAFLLDLLAAVLKTGAPTDQAIDAVAVAVREHGGEQLRRTMEPLAVVGRLLRLGTEPQLAWSRLEQLPGWAPVAAAGRRCASSGARLAGALADTAEQLRAQQSQLALVRAQRVGVWALLPLGCCFLPAFVCIGIVPVVLGVAGQLVPR